MSQPETFPPVNVTFDFGASITPANVFKFTSFVVLKFHITFWQISLSSSTYVTDWSLSSYPPALFPLGFVVETCLMPFT